MRDQADQLPSSRGLKKRISYLSWECYTEGFSGFGEDYCLKLIQTGLKYWKKKAKKIKENSKSEDQPVDCNALMQKKRFLVWTTSTVKTVFWLET